MRFIFLLWVIALTLAVVMIPLGRWAENDHLTKYCAARGGVVDGNVCMVERVR